MKRAHGYVRADKYTLVSMCAFLDSLPEDAALATIMSVYNKPK